MAPLSLGGVHWQSRGGGRTRGHICYYTTELLELRLQSVLMWQDRIRATLLLELSTKPGWRDKGLAEIYFLYEKRKRGNK